jgi:GTP cyclohydrolase I
VAKANARSDGAGRAKALRAGVDKAAIRGAVVTILRAIGESPEREGLAETPRRIADMYEELFSGIHQDPMPLLTVGFKDEKHKEMVVVKDIPFASMCEHHLIPMHGVAHVGYIPQGRIVGISKIARVVETLARRPQVQERLTSQIADLLMEGLRARGAAVVIDAEHLCYDRETEVLTPDGWVRFDRLGEGTQVAQVDPRTLEMSWAVPTAYIRYPYQGQMIHWRSDTLDLLVTPDHRMVYKSEWAFDHTSDSSWKIAPAASLPARFYVPQAVVWKARDADVVQIGDIEIPPDDYARFMGVWLAEGCTRQSKGDTVISQNDGEFADGIWRLLSRLPFGFRRVPQPNRPHIQFKSSNPTLFHALALFGKSGDKYVPGAIKTMSARQISTFLNWFALGDGHRYSHNPLRVQYVSKSSRMMDDIQELSLRVGQAGSLQRYPECSRLEVRTHKRRPIKGYKTYSLVHPYHQRRIKFDDEVFCVSVPAGALLVRRNGRPAVSGNCMTIRGVKKPGSRVVTSATRGIFRENPSTRTEFLSLLKRSGP